MPLYQVILLAVLQGITEFLPISSSAHLALVPWLTGWEDQGLTFDIALHFGTLAAVLIYFFRDWVRIIAAGIGIRATPGGENTAHPHLLWMLGAATVPVGIAGILGKDAVETTLRSPYVIGFMLIAVGLLMGWADRLGQGPRKLGDVTWTDALAIGAAQALAIIPGTSRSGITITTGLFRRMERAEAARFSFLLSTPAIGGAAVLAFRDLMNAGGIPSGEAAAFVAGILVSALTGCLVISFFLKFLRKFSLKFFVAYRIIFGILVLALAFFRR
ncbi:MAG: undecaprenyl-diphosphatase UppP [Bryobacteraceae bacterium]|nr:undecaprenyl-diphosphatase UppP [Bryobacteraceae bacterium]